jgi:hypothetical protein
MTGEHEERELLLGLHVMLKDRLEPLGIGFMLFLNLRGRIGYIASSRRDDSLKVLQEWRARQRVTAHLRTSAISGARAFVVDEYPRLSAAAGELAGALHESADTDVALFLFSYADKSFAWALRGDRASELVLRWLDVRGSN